MSANAELIFGVNVPAAAGPGADPVGLAEEAERLGYDFVSTADHPCGPDPSYETTTMLAWIAARTTRIKVASRVLAVPFRRPALVAKLAAPLDLLSGGRFILGLGAGYSDQEIAAVGGPALSPAEKVDGLAEAIQIIRGAWTQPGYTLPGRQHRVLGILWIGEGSSNDACLGNHRSELPSRARRDAARRAIRLRPATRRERPRRRGYTGAGSTVAHVAP